MLALIIFQPTNVAMVMLAVCCLKSNNINKSNYYFCEFQVSEQKILSSLKANLADIIKLVPEPIKLANDLYSKNMLARLDRDKVVENHVPTRYEKASILMNEVERNFRVTDNVADHFLKLCNVLMQQDSPSLTKLVDKMISQSKQTIDDNTIASTDESDDTIHGNATELIESDIEIHDDLIESDDVIHGNETVLRESDHGNSTKLKKSDHGNSTVLIESDHGNSTELKESDHGNSTVLIESTDHGNSTELKESDHGNSTVLIESDHCNSTELRESNDVKCGTATVLRESDDVMHGNSTLAHLVTHDNIPYNILKTHTPVLLGIISDPDKLSDEVWAKELLSDGVRDRIKTTLGISRYDKASMILIDVSRYMKASDSNDTIIKFCDILINHGQPGLKEIAEKMIALLTD